LAGGKIDCVSDTPDEVQIRTHAEPSGSPENRITLLSAVIDPTAASAKR
jgi:hypothetical protein